MEAGHDWYRALTAQERSWVGLVAQAGIAAFIEWFRDPSVGHADAAAVFDAAPRELTRSITLRQTLDLIRTVVEVVEDEVSPLAEPGEEALVREAVLVYSREVAFGAAQVYAGAAEARGAWDARLEALVVDAVLRGEADDSMQSRATALGWGSVSAVTVVAGVAPAGADTSAVDALRRAATRRGAEALAALQRDRLILVLGGASDPLAVATHLADHFGPGPIVVGPTVPHLFAAGRSARAALSGLNAAPAWPDAPRPVSAGELVAERAVAGDPQARRHLIDAIYRPLVAHPALIDTATTFLELGGTIEATSRHLYVHTNTVRYRLGRISQVIGYDITAPREAFTVHLALALGRLDARPQPAPRSITRPGEPLL
jgi:DNA-binding PucR family transcriptional regulator